MGAWDRYESRLDVVGRTRRDAAYKREVREIINKDHDSLSYHKITIDGVEQEVMIVTSRNTNQRRIMSIPGESIKHGGLVHWMDNYWLITEKDADTTVYEKGLMEQCNHILKWISDDGVLHEQWCIISDSTKLMCARCARQFGILETVCKNYLLNCWKALKQYSLQRSNEICRRECLKRVLIG